MKQGDTFGVRAVRWVAESWLLVRSPRLSTGVHNVRALPRDATRIGAAHVDKLRAAFDIIAREYPAALAHFRSDVRCVLLGSIASCYWPATQTVVLDVGLLAAHPPLAIAMTLVHEGAHARLFVRRVRHHASRMGRIERACIRQSLRLLRGIPDADLYRNWLLDRVSGLVGLERSRPPAESPSTA